MNNAVVINNVQDWLKANNRSQKWLAEQIAITPGLMSQILSGKRKLQTKQLINIATVINVPLEELTMSQAERNLQAPSYQLRGSLSNESSKQAFDQLLWDIERYVELEDSANGR